MIGADARAMAIWDALPEGARAWLEEWLVLPYESVIDIDEKGDEWFDGPHIYVAEFDPVRGPFRDYRRVKLATTVQWAPRQADPDPKTRVEKFPRMPKSKSDSAVGDDDGGDDADRHVGGAETADDGGGGDRRRRRR
jgi:hypothetical protein